VRAAHSMFTTVSQSSYHTKFGVTLQQTSEMSLMQDTVLTTAHTNVIIASIYIGSEAET